MKVGEIMSEQPVCVAPETDIVTAAVSMADYELGALPVCEQGRLVGIITSRDIVFRYLAGRSHDGRLVAHYMTRDPVTIGPGEPLERAKALMSQHQIRRLPVCKHGRLIGMIAERDLPATRASRYRRSSHKGPMQLMQR
jgi:CBS domain-containing protein